MAERAHQVTLITGAGRGLGRAIAGALHRDGYKVAVTDVDEGAAVSVAQSLSADGRTARAYRLDVSSAEQVADVFASVTRDLGRRTLSSTMQAFIRVIPFSTCLKPHGIAFSTPEGRLPLQPGVRSYAARTDWRRHCQCRVDGRFLGQSRRRTLQRVESRACDVHEVVGAGTRPLRNSGQCGRPV